jgi:hypothetical protein
MGTSVSRPGFPAIVPPPRDLHRAAALVGIAAAVLVFERRDL